METPKDSAVAGNFDTSSVENRILGCLNFLESDASMGASCEHLADQVA